MTRQANGPRDRDAGSGRTTRPPEAAGAGDVVFDFSEIGGLDLPSLSILFTARQVMERRDRRVWVTGLPPQFWSYLRSMGLEGWFRQFPGTGPGEA